MHRSCSAEASGTAKCWARRRMMWCCWMKACLMKSVWCARKAFQNSSQLLKLRGSPVSQTDLLVAVLFHFAAVEGHLEGGGEVDVGARRWCRCRGWACGPRSSPTRRSPAPRRMWRPWTGSSGTTSSSLISLGKPEPSLMVSATSHTKRSGEREWMRAARSG